MHGYAHDFDLYRAWAELVILGRFDPPERQYAAGTAYLRGLGRGRVRAVHGIEEVQPADRAPRRRGAAAAEPGSRRRRATWVRGTSSCATPTPRWCATRCSASSPASGSSCVEAQMNVVMISPGYPAEMAYFTRGLAAVGRHRSSGSATSRRTRCPPAAREALAHYEQVDLADEGAVLGALHGLARHARSTRWSACGSRT